LRHAVFQMLGADEFAGGRVGPEANRACDQTAKAKSVSLTVVVPIVVVVSIVVVSMAMIVASIVVTVTTIVVTVTMIVVVPAALVIRLVFSGPYEVHRPITGVILSAMLAPIPRMVGRYV
jgi:hypothetical protein